MVFMNFFKLFNRSKGHYNHSIMCINIAPWKRDLFKTYLSNKYDNIIYIPLKNDIFDYVNILKKSRQCSILVWGYRECKNLSRFVEEFGLSIIRVEDGFVRGRGLGVDKVIPYSLCFDHTGLYYNAKSPSDFEKLVNNRQNILTEELLQIAKHYRELFIKYHITKYNIEDSEKNFKYPNKTRERILVVGQNENDNSIIYSNSKITKNLDLIKFAKSENPNAEIVYKQHPDDIRNELNLKPIKSLCDIVINTNVLIDELLIDIDKVYTISSLFGLEALIRGYSVYTTGLPFYAGWGLTHDLISTDRRSAQLSVDELFALSYLIYPKYFDKSFNQISAKIFLDSFIEQISGTAIANGDLVLNDSKDCNSMSNQYTENSSINKKKLQKLINAHISTSFDSYCKKELPSFFDSYYKKILTSSIDYYVDFESDTRFLNSCKESCFVNIIFDNICNNFSSNSSLIKDYSFVKYSSPFFDYSIFLEACRNDIVRYHSIIRCFLLKMRKLVRGFIICKINDIAQIEFTWVCRELKIPVIFIDIHNSILLNCNFNRFLKYLDFIVASDNHSKELIIKYGFDSNKVSCANLSIFSLPRYSVDDNEISVSKEEFFAIHNLDPNNITIALYIDANDANDSNLKSKVKQIISLCSINSYQLVIIDENNVLLSLNLDKYFISYDNSFCLKTNIFDSFYYSQLIIYFAISKTIKYFENKFNNIVCYSSDVDPDSSVKHSNDLSYVNSLIINDLSPSYNTTIPHIDSTNENHPSLFDVLSCFEHDFIKKKNSVYNYSEINYILSKSVLPNTIGTIVDHSKSMQSNTKYYPSLLQLSELKTYDMVNDIGDFITSDFVFQYELKTNSTKRNFKHMVGKLWRPQLIVGDGFLRSVGLGVLGSSALGITLDARTSYYDSTKPSTMETILNSDFTLTDEQLSYCKETIEYIVNNKISKYNHAPDFYLKLGNHDRKILIVDQRYGDMSVAKGSGDSSLFSKMLDEALSIEDCDVIVKQHPDSISGGKSSYMSNDILDIVKSYSSNLYVVNYDINPYSLMKYITDVYVCSSGLGFEALMAGKNVKCFGIPFYSGWGVTTDYQKCSRRQKLRSLEEIFYVSYVLCSRYYIPNSETVCGPLEMAKYLKSQRDLL